MTLRRGEIWRANLNPTRGSEQAGTRPVIIFQNDVISKYTTTVLAIPLTANLRRASLPSCVLVTKSEGGLANDPVALCHQLRVLDKTRLERRLGILSEAIISAIETRVMFTIGIV